MFRSTWMYYHYLDHVNVEMCKECHIGLKGIINKTLIPLLPDNISWGANPRWFEVEL